jgi:hypothetical protein
MVMAATESRSTIQTTQRFVAPIALRRPISIKTSGKPPAAIADALRMQHRHRKEGGVIEATLLMIVGLASATGEQLMRLPQTPPPAARHQADKNPYRQLFEVPPIATPTAKVDPIAGPFWRLRHEVATDRPQPMVVCGMLIVPADPSVDPGILIDPNALKAQGAAPSYSLQVLKPELCAPQ